MELIEKIEILEKGKRTLTQDDQALLIKFRLMGAEEENENKRVYPRPVLAKAVEDLKARLAKRKASFAMTDHKDDEKVDDVAAVLEDVEMKGNDVWATARVLPTQRGKNVQALIRNGAAVGVSAKATGRVEKGIVQPGLVLRGFDFVLDPGFGTYADKSSILESVEVPDEDDGAVTEEQLREFGLVEDGLTEENLKARFEFALRSGYRGDFASFKKTFEKE